MLPWSEMTNGRIDDRSDAARRRVQSGLEILEEVLVDERLNLTRLDVNRLTLDTNVQLGDLK